MDNYFNNLNKIKCETSEKNKLTYVSWSDAWLEVKKVHPESNYIIYENIEWFPFWESTYGIDVKVGVIINNIEHIVRLPVMDGANNAMTKEEQNYTVDKIVWANGKKVWDDIAKKYKTEKKEM